MLPADIRRKVIATHPLVVAGETVCRNPYFVPPDDYIAPDWPEREVGWLLTNLSRLQLAEDELRASEARYRALSSRLLEAQEMERRTVARELHDDLGQILTGVKLALKRAGRARSRRSANDLAEGIRLVDEAIVHLRDLARDLRPTILDDLGLAAAVRWYAGRQARGGGFALDLDVDALEGVRLAPAVETACFRLVQEAFANIGRHSAAHRAEVRAAVADGAAEILVGDDGRGFEPELARRRPAGGGSLGLLSMEERVSLAGGRLAIESAPGRGAAIRARFRVAP